MSETGPRVVFMGSPVFAVPSLEALAAAGCKLAGVVTQPDRPAGRGARTAPPAVKVAAEALGVEVAQPETLKDAAIIERIAAWRPEVIVVAAYGRILPRAVLAIPARGCINVHASLLPRWRGASPIAASILAGDAETGVTIMEMVAKMDAGAIVSQSAEAILPDDTAGTLEPRLARLGAVLLVETLPGWFARTIQPREQDDGVATYCRTIEKSEGSLRKTMTVNEAERAVRAYNPWPGAAVTYLGERLALWRARVADGPEAAVGSLALIGRAPAVRFDDGWLALDEVQRPGGRRVTGEQFVNGERGSLASRVELA